MTLHPLGNKGRGVISFRNLQFLYSGWEYFDQVDGLDLIEMIPSMSNIFKLAYIYSDEDYFTACLEYLMNGNPTLGQAYVDQLLKQAGIESSRFIRAFDHPFINQHKRKDKPDFLLQCENFNIVLEHKIESRLGPSQLERYLEIVSKQQEKTYLALISNCSHKINPQVIQSNSYLRPTTSSYFRWRDLYSVFANHSDRLSKEFSDLMLWFGMGPIKLEGFWSDLFDNCEKGEVYRACCKAALEAYFKKEVGAKRCALDGSSRETIYGYNISYPVPWMHLLFICLKPIVYLEDSKPGTNLEPPYIRAHIWVPDGHPYLYSFQGLEEEITSPQDTKIAVQGLEHPSPATWPVKNVIPMCVAT